MIPALPFAPRTDARYIRYMVRWAKPALPRPAPEKLALQTISAKAAIAAIEIAVVRERPLPSTTLPLELPRWSDCWF